MAGRKKGGRNRNTVRAQEFAQAFLRDAEYTESVRLRIIQGEQWIEEMIWAYAYGKPKEFLDVHQTSDGSLPGTTYQVAWMDYRQFFAQGIDDPQGTLQLHDAHPDAT